jgi:hypothetical protein
MAISMRHCRRDSPSADGAFKVTREIPVQRPRVIYPGLCQALPRSLQSETYGINPRNWWMTRMAAMDQPIDQSSSTTNDWAEHERTYRGLVKAVFIFAPHVLLILPILAAGSCMDLRRQP